MKEIIEKEFSHLHNIKTKFPEARTTETGNIVYLDNAATTQRPESVLLAMDEFNRYYNANIHRGIHWLSDKATQEVEHVREKVAKFINSPDTKNIIFTHGTTHAINIVARGMSYFSSVPCVTELEHHANIVPWQMYFANKPHVIKINKEYELENIENQLLRLPKHSIVALTHISNVTGTINKIRDIIKIAHQYNHYVLIDGAQAVGHLDIDVDDLNCDFYCFSGHKMYGPTGIGVLYGKKELLDKIPPLIGGGEMIENVTFQKTTFNDLPYKFEGGTPNIQGIIGLGAAIDFINVIGKDNIKTHVDELSSYAYTQITNTGCKILGPMGNRGPLVSWLYTNIHPHDMSQVLDQSGIATRSGHHCAQPLHDLLGIPGSTRASFAVYNKHEDIDLLVKGIEKSKEMFA